MKVVPVPMSVDPKLLSALRLSGGGTGNVPTRPIHNPLSNPRPAGFGLAWIDNRSGRQSGDWRSAW